jgi:hypothetical protein
MCDNTMEVYVPSGRDYKPVTVKCGNTHLRGGTYQCRECEEKGPPWWKCRHGQDVSEIPCGRCEGEDWD